MPGIKLNPKPQKLVLNQSAMIDDFFENVEMLSLLSAYEPYHLAWHLNRSFPVDFVRDDTRDIQHGGHTYIAYRYIDEINHIEHTLFATRNKTNYILPELKRIDFIWMIQGGHLVAHFIRDIPVLIKKISGVSDCRKILHENISNRHVFLV